MRVALLDFRGQLFREAVELVTHDNPSRILKPVDSLAVWIIQQIVENCEAESDSDLTNISQ